ncbi:MAG: GTPase [Planctomycetota bacterium]|jgi:GTPase Era involved in 16S rRNA processing
MATTVLKASRDLSPVIEGLEAFVKGDHPFPRLTEKRATVLANLHSLAIQHENLRGALLILLLGGTGVGKSTLINALAGREIAEVSEIRPCTRRITFYSHEANDLRPIDEIISPEDELATHRDAALERKILIDPPDFDSTRRENREVLERVLEVSDLVLVLVDREKYRNHSLYTLLARYRQEKRFLFLVNKADRLFDRGIVDDFRESLREAGFEDAQIQVLSAREAAAGRMETAGEFPRLQAVIGDEIDRVRIREIKESNLGGLLENVIASIEACVPEKIERGIDDWLSHAEAGLSAVAYAAREEVFRALFSEDRALRDFIVNAQALGMSAVFGAYLLVLNRFRGLLRPGAADAMSLDPVRVKSEIDRSMERADGERVARVIENHLSRIREDGKALGVDVPAGSGVQTPAVGARKLLDGLRDRVTEGIRGLLENAATGNRMGLRNIAYNLLPFSLIGYVIATIVMRFIKGNPPGLEFLVSGLVLLVVLCAVQGVLAEGGFRRHAARFLLGMESRIEALGLEFARDTFGKHHRAFAEAVKKAAAELGELKKEAKDATQRK